MSTRPDIDAGVFDVDATAAHLGVSRKYVFDHTYDVRFPELRQGWECIPAVKIAGKWRFREEALNALLRGEFSPPAVSVTPIRQRRSA
jgi:hypothetical protein